jgi:hypothetical protein
MAELGDESSAGGCWRFMLENQSGYGGWLPWLTSSVSGFCLLLAAEVATSHWPLAAFSTTHSAPARVLCFHILGCLQNNISLKLNVSNLVYVLDVKSELVLYFRHLNLDHLLISGFFI